MHGAGAAPGDTEPGSAYCRGVIVAAALTGVVCLERVHAVMVAEDTVPGWMD
jgi:hypothetical protein